MDVVVLLYNSNCNFQVAHYAATRLPDRLPLPHFLSLVTRTPDHYLKSNQGLPSSRIITLYSMLISPTPRKLRPSYLNVGHSIAFCTDNRICLPIFSISRLNHFSFSAFSLLSCLPTLKLIGYQISSKANYGRLVYLTRRDSHPLYDTTLLGRTVRHLSPTCGLLVF